MSIERIKAIATIIVTAAVNIANVYGYAVDAEPFITAITSVLSVVTIIYAWWKNQNITDEAQQAQLLLDDLKAAKKEAKNG